MFLYVLHAFIRFYTFLYVCLIESPWLEWGGGLEGAVGNPTPHPSTTAGVRGLPRPEIAPNNNSNNTTNHTNNTNNNSTNNTYTNNNTNPPPHPWGRS